MRINVSGKNINVGDALVEYTEDALSTAVKKYFENAIDADVVFIKEKSQRNLCFKISEFNSH